MAYTPKKGDYYRASDGKIWVYDGVFPAWQNSNIKGTALPRNATGQEVDRTSKEPLNPLVIEPAGKGKISSGPLNNKGPDKSGTGTVRYPEDGISVTTDYVFFQFGKYKPPFSRDADTGGGDPYAQYNASVSSLDLKSVSVLDPTTNKATNVETIVLPMPQDLSNELKSDWSAKSFTRLGRTAIAAAGAGRFSDIAENAGDISGNLKSIQGAVVSNVLNNIPGVGGNLTINDITGSTRGIVLNPNAEVLYDSPNMREIGMVFKMVPRNSTEAANIKKICDAFRAASLPRYGADDNLSNVSLAKASEDGKTKEEDFEINGDNFIRVPYLCKFTFMSGSKSNPWIAQFKPCAITRVQVNYTPDGTYATYEGGSPIATELSINFLESKVIFTNEIAGGF